MKDPVARRHADQERHRDDGRDQRAARRWHEAVRRARVVGRDAAQARAEHGAHDRAGHASASRRPVLLGDGGDHHVRARLRDAPHHGRGAGQLRASLRGRAHGVTMADNVRQEAIQ